MKDLSVVLKCPETEESDSDHDDPEAHIIIFASMTSKRFVFSGDVADAERVTVDLRWLAKLVGVGGNRAKLVEAGAIEYIVTALRANPTVAAIQEAGCNMLSP